MAPDIFQEKICDLFHDLEHVRTFIHNLLVVSHGTYEEHIAKLDVVLNCLSKEGLKCKIDMTNVSLQSQRWDILAT